MTKKAKGKKAEKAKAKAEAKAEDDAKEIQLNIEGLDEEMMKMAVEQLKNMVSPCR